MTQITGDRNGERESVAREIAEASSARKADPGLCQSVIKRLPEFG
jgi:hypothetical protein